jgi:hypothetical protein
VHVHVYACARKTHEGGIKKSTITMAPQQRVDMGGWWHSLVDVCDVLAGQPCHLALCKDISHSHTRTPLRRKVVQS